VTRHTPPWWRRLALACEARWHGVRVVVTCHAYEVVLQVVDDRRAVQTIGLAYASLPGFAAFVATLDETRPVALQSPDGVRLHVPACAVPKLRTAARAVAAARPPRDVTPRA